jgi:4-diphosphocytidyl-2-C-methyl-D-erythritol kinase
MNAYVELPSTNVVTAPAKINPFLRVLGRREDGYHELETMVLPLGLADSLEIHAAAGEEFRTLSLALSVEEVLPGAARGVPHDETNLVLRAAKALAELRGVRGFADITLQKLVPAAAGLGGGSSDAAATLGALNHLWGCGLGSDELTSVAAGVGSDVPALLAGGPVVARGRGERVEPVAAPELTWLVVTFGFGVSTRDAFGWWDQDGAEPGPDPVPLIEALRAMAGAPQAEVAPAIGPLMFNDLQGAVVRRHLEIDRVMNRLRDEGAAAVLLSGSGPSVAALFADTSSVDRGLTDELAEMSGARPAWVRSLGRP